VEFECEPRAYLCNAGAVYEVCDLHQLSVFRLAVTLNSAIRFQSREC
jgi:hypothetical protein